MDFSVGDIVQMKKSHPCGSAQWEILRTGIATMWMAVFADVGVCVLAILNAMRKKA